MEYDLRYLAEPLPEDIKKLKWAGDFDMARKVIESRLSSDTVPESLKKRLSLELEILERIPGQYPYDYQTALAMMKERFRDFREEELAELWQQDNCDWIYIRGQVHFHERFLENLLKTRADYRNRDLQGEKGPDRNRELLQENVLRAKEEGCRRIRIRLRTTIRLTEQGAKKCLGQQIRVYLPLPVEYAQVQDYRLWNISPLPKMVAGPEYPQRTAVFETEYSGKETFSAEFEFENVTEYRQPDPAAVLEQQPSFYTEEQLPHIRFTPYIRNLCREIVGEESNPLLKVRRIYDYITTHVRYSYVRHYSTFDSIPEYVGSSLKGDCGFQALLFITLCRAAGVPARWQSGLYATPEYVGSHDWAQYYVAPYGWLFADCSFGGSAFRQGDEERRVFYGANLDPYRIPQASEFQHGFCLPEGALRFDPYDNQVGEIICQGKALHGYGEDFETLHELVELTELH